MQDAPAPTRRTLRRHELPTLYGVSRWKVAELLRSGELPSVKVGRAVLVDLRDADRLFGVRHGEG